MVTIESNPQDISNRLTAIEATIPHLATKADVAKLATKDDIANMATRADIANMATRADIANMATRDDIANMATKDDVAALNAKFEDANKRLTAIERGQVALVKWFVSVALAFIAILTPLLLMILERLP